MQQTSLATGPNFPEYVENWDEYFMYLAEAASIKSKDPRCRVGAIIVSSEHLVLSTGFNGLARGMFDDQRLLANAEEKLRVICHAEANAIFNAARIGVALEGASIYVNKFPCLACCNAIVQTGISRIYTHDDRFWDDDPSDSDHTRKIAILKQAHVAVIAPFHPHFTPREPITLKKKTSAPPRKAPSRSSQAAPRGRVEEAAQRSLFARKR
jgi:dCMP deaminase